ncbi:delta-5 desaturase [Stipitochalara longipes BDJ]|nr:delta-5 desaturase [Stipitochalara longipes BDJ]
MAVTTLNGGEGITLEELRSAGTSEKAWVAIRGKVYDVTDFADSHPGGKDFLLATVARDATAMFESLHDPKAIKVLAKRQLGTLIETDVPQYPQETLFQQDIRKSVSEYFKRIGMHPREAPWMLLPYAISFGAYFISYFVMFSPKISREFTTLPWIAALVHGWSHAILGLYPLHDATHASFTRSPSVWNFIRRFHDMLSGLNSHIWFHEHVMGHHPFTNVVDHDPDVFPGNPDIVRFHESQSWWSYYSWQSYYLYPLYAQAAWSRWSNEWYQLLVARNYKGIAINPLPLKEYLWCGVYLLSFIMTRIVIPRYFFHFSLLRIFLIYTCSNSFWSLYLLLVFQASHVNDEVAWPQPDENNQMEDWAKLQVESSMDFAHGSWLTTFMTGSLNYQAVHHLLPYVSQYYYPALAPIVQEVCAKHDVKYNLTGSVFEAMALHTTRLSNMGKDPGELSGIIYLCQFL